jgi:hypothetical protein
MFIDFKNRKCNSRRSQGDTSLTADIAGCVDLKSLLMLTPPTPGDPHYTGTIPDLTVVALSARQGEEIPHVPARQLTADDLLYVSVLLEVRVSAMRSAKAFQKKGICMCLFSFSLCVFSFYIDRKQIPSPKSFCHMLILFSLSLA